MTSAKNSSEKNDTFHQLHFSSFFLLTFQPKNPNKLDFFLTAVAKYFLKHLELIFLIKIVIQQDLYKSIITTQTCLDYDFVINPRMQFQDTLVKISNSKNLLQYLYEDQSE